jgi:16S rRNA (cytosine1402-N4)-methyltransferase
MTVHLPVMLREVTEVLRISPGGTYVDATVGLGGHAEKMLALAGAGGMVIGIDRDDEALMRARERLSDTGVVLRKGRFSELAAIVRETGVHEVDGVLFDFGVSMMQFKEPGRGFSFNTEEPLDMRMDRTQELTAEDIVNTYPEKELEKMLREYADEWFSKRIARAITAYRTKKRIATCAELAGIVSAAYGKRGRVHPATKTFQALRISVNDEIAEIGKGLGAALGVLRRGGRLCTIAYHSLEDRTVKNFLRAAEREGTIRIITKKPLSPSYDEVRENASARSAKLRGAERL